jgi:hypothetical protein
MPVPQGPDEARIRYLAHSVLDYMSEQSVDWMWDKFVGGSMPTSYGEALVYREWVREGYVRGLRKSGTQQPGFH